MTEAPQLRQLAARARRRQDRLRGTSQVQATLLWALPLSAGILVGTLLLSLGLDLSGPAFEALRTLGGVLAAAATLPALGIAVCRALRRRTPEGVALANLDVALEWKGRLSGGFALVEAGRADGLAPLAIRDAEQHAARVPPLSTVLPGPPREPLLLSVLVAAVGLLTLAISSLPPPTPPRAAASARLAQESPAARVLSRATRELAREAATLEGAAGAAAQRVVTELTRTTTRLAHPSAAASPQVSRSLLARAAGRVASSGPRGETAALRHAGATLAEAQLGRALGRALAQLDPRGASTAGERLARRLGTGARASLAQRESLAQAAERAASQLAHTGRSRDLEGALRDLARALRKPSLEPAAQAARRAGAAAGRRVGAARASRLADRARAALARAWRTAGGEGSSQGAPRGRTGQGKAQASSKRAQRRSSRAKRGAPERLRAGSRRRAPSGGGGRVAGAVRSGDPARGPAGAKGPPGGGTGDPRRAGTRPARARSKELLSIRGQLGRRGEAVLSAVAEVDAGRPSPQARRLIAEYGQVDERALQRAAVPPDRRDLVRHYLEAIRGR